MRDDKIPPFRLWVFYCGRCGNPILADTRKVDTSCPDCPLERGRKNPPIRFMRYERVRR